MGGERSQGLSLGPVPALQSTSTLRSSSLSSYNFSIAIHGSCTQKFGNRSRYPLDASPSVSNGTAEVFNALHGMRE